MGRIAEVEVIADHVGEANQDVGSWWEVGEDIDNDGTLRGIFRKAKFQFDGA